MVDLDTLMAWGVKVTGLDGEVMSRCIDAASDYIESFCRRRFLTASYQARFSGDRAISRPGESLCSWIYLQDPNGLAATMPVTGTPTVVEGSTALSVVDAHVTASLTNGEYAVLDRQAGSLMRAQISGGRIYPTSWESGWGNVYVTWTAGYTARPASNKTMPDDIELVCMAIARKLFRLPSRIGIDLAGGQGDYVNYADDLDATMLSTLRSYRVVSMPSMLGMS